MIVAADPATRFANLFVRYQWKVARLVEVLDRVPFQQCLVFLNHRSRYACAYAIGIVKLNCLQCRSANNTAAE